MLPPHPFYKQKRENDHKTQFENPERRGRLTREGEHLDWNDDGDDEGESAGVSEPVVDYTKIRYEYPDFIPDPPRGDPIRPKKLRETS